jgi:hypothetical protein
MPRRPPSARPSAHLHHRAHGRVDAQALSVIEVLIPGQPTEEGLTQERGQAVARVAAGACVLQHVGGCVGELEGVVEFAVGQQAGVAGDFGAMEFEAEAAIELGSERIGLAVTHQKFLS